MKANAGWAHAGIDNDAAQPETAQSFWHLCNTDTLFLWLSQTLQSHLTQAWQLSGPDQTIEVRLMHIDGNTG